MVAQLGHSQVGIDEVPSLHLLDPLTQSLVKLGPLVVVEVVPAVGEHVVERHQLDHLALGQVGGLVEDETPVVDVGFEGLHRFGSLRPRRLVDHGVVVLLVEGGQEVCRLGSVEGILPGLPVLGRDADASCGMGRSVASRRAWMETCV
jgi:hypothetical protein